MGVLRKVGMFTGQVLKRVGDVGGTVLKGVNAIATPFKPMMMSNPIGQALVQGLNIATDATKVAKIGGNALISASQPRMSSTTMMSPIG